MKTESHSINDVLSKNATSFFIPPFQRAYAWGRPEIERYFNDVRRIIDSELDPTQHDKLEHFFGTVVIKEEKVGFAHRSVVVDGQQRLTTTLIFLIALRDLETDEHAIELINNTYLTNPSSTYTDKIKLKQVTKDWDSYRALVNGTELPSGVIRNAYNLFKRLITKHREEHPEVSVEHYITAIQRMNVAVIFLDERPFKGEDPQIIFETLNSLGKPLTLSDLVRNFVLLKMKSEEQSKVYEKIWHPKIEEVFNENTSKFFRDYLQLKRRTSLKVVSNNNTKELYSQFKSYVDQAFETRNDFIADIVRFVPWYKWIIFETYEDNISTDTNANTQIKELLRNIFHDIKAEAFKPFVLGLLEFHQDKTKTHRLHDARLIEILSFIRTYLIRRRVLGLSQGENNNIVLLAVRIEDLATGSISIQELLSTQFFSLRTPNDTEIAKGLRDMKFYEQLKKYSKFILGKTEENNTTVSVNFRDKNVTIEHIMPQTLTESWRDELGDDYENIHKSYIHNIGNLILTEFNSEIGNKSFAEKKIKLATSSLHYRLSILEKDVWDESAILEHQERMISWFLDAFPVPDEYKYRDNWKIDLVDQVSFSPLADDAGSNAGGNRPETITIDGTTLPVDWWQDVFIAFVRFIKESPTYDFDMILNNQYSLFYREHTIITWDQLRELIEDSPEQITRYKTFEGISAEKVIAPTNDTWFIHTGISAGTCMNRIAQMMNQLYMDEESVIITLR